MDMIKKAANVQGISQAEVARQSLFFGQSEGNYYRVLEIAKREGVHPAIIMQQAFSLADALMSPTTTISDVLKDTNPRITFADAMKSLSELQAVLTVKLERQTIANEANKENLKTKVV